MKVPNIQQIKHRRDTWRNMPLFPHLDFLLSPVMCTESIMYFTYLISCCWCKDDHTLLCTEKLGEHKSCPSETGVKRSDLQKLNGQDGRWPSGKQGLIFGSKLEVANDSLCSKCVLKRISGKRGGKNVWAKDGKGCYQMLSCVHGIIVAHISSLQ